MRLELEYTLVMAMTRVLLLNDSALTNGNTSLNVSQLLSYLAIREAVQCPTLEAKDVPSGMLWSQLRPMKT